jgi:hypothetical protein
MPQNLSPLVLRSGLEVELQWGDFLPINGIVEYAVSEPIRLRDLTLTICAIKATDHRWVHHCCQALVSTMPTSAPAPAPDYGRVAEIGKELVCVKCQIASAMPTWT